MGFIAFAISAATANAIELFVSGVTAGISLYCGIKTPKRRRRK